MQPIVKNQNLKKKKFFFDDSEPLQLDSNIDKIQKSAMFFGLKLHPNIVKYGIFSEQLKALEMLNLPYFQFEPKKHGGF